MAMGAPHPRVLGFLGRALSLELTAVQQYMTQASLVELWGELEAAEREVRDLDDRRTPDEERPGDDWGPGTARPRPPVNL